MGKSEIVLIIVGIILTIILTTTMAPSFIKTGSFAKTSLVLTEIKSFRETSINYLNTNSTGDYLNINAEKLKYLLPGFNLHGTGETSYFTNKYNIKYSISSVNGNSYLLKLENLNSIDTDVEEHIIENFKHIVKNKNDLELQDTTDGIITLELEN